MKKLSKKDQYIWDYFTSNIFLIKRKNLQSPSVNFKKEIVKKKLKPNTNFDIDRKIFKTLKNNSLRIDATLDLHGYNRYEAKSRLNLFVKNCYKNKLQNLLIITGKGENSKGVLKLNTPNWLMDEMISKFIVGFNLMPNQKGGQGALFIKLKNVNKYK